MLYELNSMIYMCVCILVTKKSDSLRKLMWQEYL
jgi:hypothetical protein